MHNKILSKLQNQIIEASHLGQERGLVREWVGTG
jgi:hypothetical protein